MIHRKNAAMATSFYATARRRLVRADRKAAGLHSTLRNNTRGSSLHRIRFEPEPLGDGHGYFRVEAHMRIVNLRVKDAPKRMNHGQRAPFGKRQPDGKRFNGIGGH